MAALNFNHAATADRWLRRFGLYDALRQARWNHWWAAIVEFAITLVFALLPLAIPFIALPMFGHNNLSSNDIWREQIRHGELYLLSTALLAPIYYFTFPQVKPGLKTYRMFPSQQLIILIFIGTICVSVLAIAATKVQAAHDTIPDQMIEWSRYLFYFCCFVFFFTLVIRNSLPESAERSLDDESQREQREIPPPEPVAQGGPAVDPEDFVRAVIADHTAVADLNTEGART